MVSRSLRSTWLVLIFTTLILFVLMGAHIRVQAASVNSVGGVIHAVQMGPLYSQSIDPNGKLLLSARLDPDGSDYDQYIWDDFTLPNAGTITDIQWYGVYDPLLFGKGGPVVDFTVSIYPSTAANTEPAVANPPLVEYRVGGNAGETSFDVINGMQINIYSFRLPTSFVAAAGTKYWVYIVASQQGSLPDWSFAAGSGGGGNHYRRTSGAGGDVLYRFAPGDAAFTLLGASAQPATPTPTATQVATPSFTPAAQPTDTPPAPTSTPVPPQIPTCFGSIVTFGMLMIFFSGFQIPRR